MRRTVGYPPFVRILRPLIWLLLPVLAACGKVQFQSTPGTPGAAAQELYGEWVGTWASDSIEGTGPLSFRAQQFEGQLVFGVDIAHPCLNGSLYQLVFSGTHLELRDQGMPVMVGDLQEGRRFVGTYSCLEDSGTWEVVWSRDLPPVADLTGTWQGEILSIAGVSPLELVLEQYVAGGRIYVRGTLELPNDLDGLLPVDGLVRMRSSQFELSLVTESGVTPQVVIGGFGDPATLNVHTGLVVTSGAPLTWTQGQATFALVPPPQ